MTNGARAAVAAKSVGVAEEGCCGYRGGAAVSAALSGGGRHYLSTDNSGPTLRVFHPSVLTFLFGVLNSIIGCSPALVMLWHNCNCKRQTRSVRRLGGCGRACCSHSPKIAAAAASCCSQGSSSS